MINISKNLAQIHYQFILNILLTVLLLIHQKSKSIHQLQGINNKKDFLTLCPRPACCRPEMLPPAALGWATCVVLATWRVAPCSGAGGADARLP
jgi:hypothetical protein